MKKNIKRISMIGLIVILAYALNRSDFLAKTLNWIEGYGPWGPVAFLLTYIVSCVFFVPSFIFTFSSGILFGFWKGSLLSILGTAIGSTCAFWVGRYLAHDWVERKIAVKTSFQALASALKRKGWKVILLARLSPVFPFLIGNYAFGVTRVPARHYFLATFLGTIPSAMVYAYLGFVTGDLALLGQDGRTRTPGEWALLGLGLVVTLFLGFYIPKLARSAEAVSEKGL